MGLFYKNYAFCYTYFQVETLLYKCLSLSWDLIESSTEKNIAANNAGLNM